MVGQARKRTRVDSWHSAGRTTGSITSGRGTKRQLSSYSVEAGEAKKWQKRSPGPSDTGPNHPAGCLEQSQQAARACTPFRHHALGALSGKVGPASITNYD